MDDAIVTHEMWQTVDYVGQIAAWWSAAGNKGPCPQPDELHGALLARIDEGRWIVDCPTPDCGDAKVVSAKHGIYICHICGEDANGGNWYYVEFPEDRAAIEKELLQIPEKHPFYARKRNWSPGQTVADIQSERKLYEMVPNRGSIKAGDQRLRGKI